MDEISRRRSFRMLNIIHSLRKQRKCLDDGVCCFISVHEMQKIFRMQSLICGIVTRLSEMLRSSLSLRTLQSSISRWAMRLQKELEKGRRKVNSVEERNYRILSSQ